MFLIFYFNIIVLSTTVDNKQENEEYKVSDGLIEFPCTVNDHKLFAMLDTGAEISVISTEVVKLMSSFF